LTLAAARQMAVEQNPAVAAARASLAAAQARAEAAENLHTIPLVTPDLPIRRKQAAVGVGIAEAGVRRAEADVIYGVTYTYIAYLYATEQLQVTQKALSNLENLRTQVRRGVEAGRTNVSKADQPRIDAYIGLARSRQKEAEAGRQRALAGLREALGLGPDCPLVLVDTQMPRISPAVDRCQVLAQALANRPELAQAAGIAEVTGYEVDAQGRRRFPNSRTFAANSDIHSQPVPAGTYGSQEDSYRPGALAPEMPPFLSGKRCDRIEQAEAYSARAAAVADKTRNLVALDVEQAYLRWQEASGQLPDLEKAAEDSRGAFDQLKEAFSQAGTRTTVSEWLSYGMLRTDLLVEVNRMRFRLLASLANLERATAGAFCPGLVPAPAPVVEPAAEMDQAKPN
jgi:outer membrane protein TolC